MNHSDVQTRMADYLDGDLRLDERALVDAHLDACGPCARDLQELQRTVSLLRALPAPETPPDLADNVIAQIRAGAGRSVWSDLVDTLRSIASPQFVVPATAMAAAAGVFFVSGGQLGGGPTPDAVERVDSAAVAKVEAKKARADIAPQSAPAQIAAASPPPAAQEEAVPRRVPTQSAPSEPPPLLARATPPVFTGNSVFQPFRQGAPFTRRVVGGSTGGVQALPGAAAAPQVQRASSLGRERLLEQRLEWLRREPAQFAAWFRERSRAEQDLWLTQFGRYAHEQEVGDEILQALLLSGDERLQMAALELGKVLLDERAEAEQTAEPDPTAGFEAASETAPEVELLD